MLPWGWRARQLRRDSAFVAGGGGGAGFSVYLYFLPLGGDLLPGETVVGGGGGGDGLQRGR